MVKSWTHIDSQLYFHHLQFVVSYGKSSGNCCDIRLTLYLIIEIESFSFQLLISIIDSHLHQVQTDLNQLHPSLMLRGKITSFLSFLSGFLGFVIGGRTHGILVSQRLLFWLPLFCVGSTENFLAPSLGEV